jgi:hypothetical protein
MVQHLGDGDWRCIAEQASKEMDSTKLIVLIGKLCGALDIERREKSRLAETSRGNERSSFLSD